MLLAGGCCRQGRGARLGAASLLHGRPGAAGWQSRPAKTWPADGSPCSAAERGLNPASSPLQQPEPPRPPACRAHSSREGPSQPLHSPRCKPQRTGLPVPFLFQASHPAQGPIHLPHLHPTFISASPGQDHAGQHLPLAASLRRASFHSRSYLWFYFCHWRRSRGKIQAGNCQSCPRVV